MGSFVPSDLKERNRATVYEILRASGGISKADIARESGISAPTVIKIIDYFTGLGLVREAGEGTGTLGRRPRLLRFDPEAIHAWLSRPKVFERVDTLGRGYDRWRDARDVLLWLSGGGAVNC